eukprot:TRINITY_DN54291_c0_g1_i2.p1 TRINITY_DN54291_c0_g1~~TRINITY_DN54291_c0_g1_i2.p1  ORF type:complete len:182 (+),score=79.02 TRINITY_DN54291_c0_g1_i2:644-1189(+)
MPSPDDDCYFMAVVVCDMKDCASCAQDSQCGWCGDDETTGSCRAIGFSGDGPHCGVCESKWIPQHTTCPAYLASQQGILSPAAKRGLAIGLPIGGGVLAASVAFCWFTRRKRKLRQQEEAERERRGYDNMDLDGADDEDIQEIVLTDQFTRSSSVSDMHMGEVSEMSITETDDNKTNEETV